MLKNKGTKAILTERIEKEEKGNADKFIFL